MFCFSIETCHDLGCYYSLLLNAGFGFIGTAKEFSRIGDSMVNKNTEDFLELSTQDQELKRFFRRVREAGRLVVKDGDDEFVVELRRATLTTEARRRLTGGGPED